MLTLRAIEREKLRDEIIHTKTHKTIIHTNNLHTQKHKDMHTFHTKTHTISNSLRNKNPLKNN